MEEEVTLSRGRGGEPLYVQVARRIQRRIEQGDLRAGDRVPSEPEIVGAMDVSRATARAALEHLLRAGAVRREQGRGTFVQPVALVQRQPALGSFTDAVRAHGQSPEQRFLRKELVDPTSEPLAVHLGTDRPIVRIVRLRLVDGAAVGLHHHLVPVDVAGAAGLTPDALAAPDASLYALLSAADVRIAGAEEHLSACAADGEEADLLSVAVGGPLLRVLRASHDDRGAPVEVTDARYVGDRIDYHVSLSRPRAAGTDSTPERQNDHVHAIPQPLASSGGHGARGLRLRQVR